MPIDTAVSGRGGFLGLELSALTIAEVRVALASRASQPRFSFIVTPNVDHVVKLSREPADGPLRAAYRAAAMRLCDSRVLAGLAALCGVRAVAIPGSDLTAALFAEQLRAGDRVAIVGGDAGTVARVQTLCPGPDYFHHEPPMGVARNPAAFDAAIAFVEDCRPHYTFLAIGAPQSEMLATLLAGRKRATGVGLCIGASIEFMTGVKRRAPRWVQRVGLEWLFRLASEPKRLWRRYLVEGPTIFALVLRWRLTGRAP